MNIVEAMWFLIEIFEETGDRKCIAECCKRHIGVAWESEYDSLKLAVKVEGKVEVAWAKADCKAWCVDCHEKISLYACDYYPIATGEWTQWLDRLGHKKGADALPIKDMFHLPRTLMVWIELFDKKM